MINEWGLKAMEREAELVNEVFDMKDLINDSEVEYFDDDLIDPLIEDDDDEDFEDEENDELIAQYDYPEEDPSTFEYVAHIITQEGFHNTFDSYSDFDEVKDEEFHRLRKLYIKATITLQSYIDSKLS